MEEKEYDEIDAIAFIRNRIGKEIANQYTDDDILLVIDTVFDFFEENDEDDEFSFNLNQLVSYSTNKLRKDPDNVIDLEHVKQIIEAELDYEESLEEE